MRENDIFNLSNIIDRKLIKENDFFFNYEIKDNIYLEILLINNHRFIELNLIQFNEIIDNFNIDKNKDILNQLFYNLSYYIGEMKWEMN